MTRTLIRGGAIVTAIDTYAADVAIEGDTIAAIFAPGSGPPGAYDVTRDATGKYVLPGGIDGPPTSTCRDHVTQALALHDSASGVVHTTSLGLSSERPALTAHTSRCGRSCPMPSEDIDQHVAATIAHYDASAESFREGTRDHDVAQNVAALLDAIEGAPPFTLLDFGCGPGRDLARFRSLGHAAVGLDGSARFVAMARQSAGCEVLHQSFLHLSLPASHFHGIFANASLFHVPSRSLPSVLGALRAALKPRGVLFSSNPRGPDEEGVLRGRYGCFWTLETWRSHVVRAGFEEISHYYRPPGRPRHEQPWLASVWRRVE